jgi:beta-lactamase regulating signal transducer with metallopeptidase domain
MLVPEEAAGLSLFSFAIGLELAQLAIVLGVLIFNFLVLSVMKRSKPKWEFLVGAIVLSQALVMIFERI